MRPIRPYVLIMMLVLAVPEVQGQLIPNLGGQRVGISAFQFLKIGAGARGVGMGEAFVAVVNDASALYWNPAGMTEFPQNQMIAAHTQMVADIRHEFLGVTYRISPQDVIGASVVALHMSDMEVTTETQPSGTGTYFTFGDIGIALSYGRKMTDQFSFGATLRYVEETLDVLKMRSFMVDLGTLYWTGLGTARFAVVIANFGGNVEPEGTVTQFDGGTTSDFQSFSVPTVFKLGFAIDPITTDEHLLTASIQLNHPNDNSEHVRFGLEYTWQRVFSLRAGLKRTIGQPVFSDDETSTESWTAGTGVRVSLGFTTLGVDYAFAAFGRLGDNHRLSVQATF